VHALRLRLTIRFVMVMVALIAGVLGAVTAVNRRREQLRGLATYHLAQSELFANEAYRNADPGCPAIPGESEREFVERHTQQYGASKGLALQRAIEHIHKSDAYRIAAAGPWNELWRVKSVHEARRLPTSPF
jgi:hypothetical protein